MHSHGTVNHSKNAKHMQQTWLTGTCVTSLCYGNHFVARVSEAKSIKKRLTMLDPVHWNGSKAELSSLAKEGSYPGTGPRWTVQDLEVFLV